MRVASKKVIQVREQSSYWVGHKLQTPNSGVQFSRDAVNPRNSEQMMDEGPQERKGSVHRRHIKFLR
jgi:hypothetical protein